MAMLTPSSNATGGAANAAFRKQLNKVYAFYTGGFIAFVIVLAIMEHDRRRHPAFLKARLPLAHNLCDRLRRVSGGDSPESDTLAAI